MNFKPIPLLVLLCMASSYARIIYVDKLIQESSTKTYDTTTRTSGKGTLKAFKTINMAVDSILKGDSVLIRGGLYQEGQVGVPNITKDGTSWTPGNFYSIMSYPGEWAIVDGQNDIVPQNGDWAGTIDLGLRNAYWHVSNLEITGGRGRNEIPGGSGYYASGIIAWKGPVKFDHLKVHNNWTLTSGNNPAGILMHCCKESIVEFCYFFKNGSLNQHGSHIENFGDYQHNAIAVNGFVLDSFGGNHNMKNIYRFNYFGDSSYMAIKHKANQLFTGRSLVSGHSYQDTFCTYGDDIHNNIIETSFMSFAIAQDFAQIHHNVIKADTNGHSIGGAMTCYKPCFYNNTLLMSTIPIRAYIYATTPNLDTMIYGYIFNNIYNTIRTTEYFEEVSLHKLDESQKINFDSVKIRNNWSKKPRFSSVDNNGSRVVFRGYEQGNNLASRYTLAQYRNIDPAFTHYIDTSSTAIFYDNTTPGKYKTKGDVSVSANTTIANAGIGGIHPYLDGDWFGKNVDYNNNPMPKITVPEYLGATDPNDPDNNAWVDKVLDLVNLGKIGAIAPTVSNVEFAENVDKIVGGTIQNVKYEAWDDSAVVKCSLFVSFDNAKTWIADTGWTGSATTINWTVKDKLVETCYIRIYAYDGRGLKGYCTSKKFSIASRVKLLKGNKAIALEGRSYSDTTKVTGGMSPYVFSVTDSLPSGLIMDSTSGVIKGKVTAVGRGKYVFKIRVIDKVNGTDSLTDSIIIDAKPKGSDLHTQNKDSLFCGTVETIYWIASDDNTVVACSLFVQHSAGASLVGTTSGTMNSLQWNIPHSLFKNARLLVRVYDAPGNFAEDSLPVNFIDTIRPITSISTPVKGTVWYAGSQQNIIWAASDNIALDSFSVFIDTAADTSALVLPRAGPAAKSSYWTIPRIQSSTCRVRLVAADISGNTVTVFSDSLFTILYPDSMIPLVTNVRVGNRTSLSTGSHHLITWDAVVLKGAIASCSLYVASDTTGALTPLGVVSDTIRSFDWKVLDKATANATITVVALTVDRIRGAGVSPLLTFFKDMPPTVDSITTDNADALVTGGSTVVRWHATDDIAVKTCSLFVRYDSTSKREPIGAVAGTVDTLPWHIPNHAMTPGWIIVAAYDTLEAFGADSIAIIVKDTAKPVDKTPLVSRLAADNATALVTGGSTVIRWRTSGSAAVKVCSLFVRYDVASVRVPIGAVAGSVDSLQWHIPNRTMAPGWLVVVAIDSSNAFGADSLAITVKDTVKPAVQLLIPRGKFTWLAGQQQNIVWKASDNMAIDSVTLALDTGEATLPIAKLGDVSSYFWTIPKVTTSHARLVLTATDRSGNSTKAMSDTMFEIGVADSVLPFVTNVVLSAGRLVMAGSKTTISWRVETIRQLAACSLYISYDTGKTFVGIGKTAEATRTFVWSVPADTASTCLLKVTAFTSDALAGSGISALFSIKNSVALSRMVRQTSSGPTMVSDTADIVESFAITAPNPDLLTAAFSYTAGNGSFSAPAQVLQQKSADGQEVYTVTIPKAAISNISGYIGMLVVTDGVATDTITMSRPVRRPRNLDSLVLEPLQWEPVCLAAHLDRTGIPAVLSNITSDVPWRYDKFKFRIIKWMRVADTSSSYGWVEYDGRRDFDFAVDTGSVCWVIANNRTVVTYGAGVTFSNLDTIRLSLAPGQWVDFALPFGYSVYTADILDATVKADSTISTDSIDFYQWIKSDSTYTTQQVGLPGNLGPEASALAGGPGRAYTVHNPYATAVELRIPPTSTARSSRTLAKKTATEAFAVRIDAAGSSYPVNSLYLGCMPSAKATRYAPAPPSLAPVVLRAYCPYNNTLHGFAVAHKKNDGVEYDVALVNNSNEARQVTLTAAALHNLPQGYDCMLIDPANERGTANNAECRVQVAANSQKHLVVVVGTPGYIAAAGLRIHSIKTMLAASYPNPFTRVIKLAYTLSYDKIDNLEIGLFALSGKCVYRDVVKKGLVPGSGVYVLGGAPVAALASGMYVVQMTVRYAQGKAPNQFTRRVTCLK